MAERLLGLLPDEEQPRLLRTSKRPHGKPRGQTGGLLQTLQSMPWSVPWEESPVGRIQHAETPEEKKQALADFALAFIAPTKAVGGMKFLDAADDAAKGIKAYHGTNNAFSYFDDAMVGTSTDEGMLGRGHYFSTDPNVIQGKNIGMPVNLQVKNPLKIALKEWGTPKTKRLALLKKLGISEESKFTAQQITEELQKRGYDSVALDYSPLGYNHVEYMVPSSKQIKSIFSN